MPIFPRWVHNLQLFLGYVRGYMSQKYTNFFHVCTPVCPHATVAETFTGFPLNFTEKFYLQHILMIGYNGTATKNTLYEDLHVLPGAPRV